MAGGGSGWFDVANKMSDMIYCIEITQKSIPFVYTEDAQKDIRGFLPLDLAEIKVMWGGYTASRCGSARDKPCCWIPEDIYLDSVALQRKVLRERRTLHIK